MDRSMSDSLSPAQRYETEFDLAAARAEINERLRNQMSFAEKAMAALMLANGGALIGLFTFVGNLVGKSDAKLKFDTTFLWIAFACFSGGVALILATHLFAFLSQVDFYNQAAHEMWRHQRTLANNKLDASDDVEEQHYRRGNLMMKIGIFLLIVALICFTLGSAFALLGVLPS